MADSFGLYTLDCTRRAAERATAILRLKLARGATSLRAIGRTAPLLGMFGTAVLMVNVLRAISLPGYRECDCAGGVAETFVPLVLSLPVAIFASVELHCLSRRIETFDLEMRTATFDLLDDLARRGSPPSLEGRQ